LAPEVLDLTKVVAQCLLVALNDKKRCPLQCLLWAVKRNSFLLSPDAGAFRATELGTNYK
jgi:hypothetical protein